MRIIFLLVALTTIVGCTSSPQAKLEMTDLVSRTIGISPNQLKHTSMCYFTITAKTSTTGNSQPCKITETADSIYIIANNNIAFSTPFRNIRSVGLPANPRNSSRHAVLLNMGNSVVSIQHNKKFGYIDEPAIQALFRRITNKGIKFDPYANFIRSGQPLYVPIILP